MSRTKTVVPDLEATIDRLALLARLLSNVTADAGKAPALSNDDIGALAGLLDDIVADLQAANRQAIEESNAMHAKLHPELPALAGV